MVLGSMTDSVSGSMTDRVSASMVDSVSGSMTGSGKVTSQRVVDGAAAERVTGGVGRRSG